jgi:hypothetical protein
MPRSSAPKKPVTTGSSPAAKIGDIVSRVFSRVRSRSGEALPKMPSVTISLSEATAWAGVPRSLRTAATRTLLILSPNETIRSDARGESSRRT